MRPMTKRILLILADLLTLVLSCFVAYYLAELLGFSPSEIFVRQWYIIVAVKMAVYIAFSMYSTDPDRLAVLDFAGSGVANLAADAVLIFFFDVSLRQNVVPMSISIIWDILLCFLLRVMLMPREAEEEAEDEYVSNEIRAQAPEAVYLPGDDERLDTAFAGDVPEGIDDLSAIGETDLDMLFGDGDRDYVRQAEEERAALPSEEPVPAVEEALPEEAETLNEAGPEADPAPEPAADAGDGDDDIFDFSSLDFDFPDDIGAEPVQAAVPETEEALSKVQEPEGEGDLSFPEVGDIDIDSILRSMPSIEDPSDIPGDEDEAAPSVMDISGDMLGDFTMEGLELDFDGSAAAEDVPSESPLETSRSERVLTEEEAAPEETLAPPETVPEPVPAEAAGTESSEGTEEAEPNMAPAAPRGGLDDDDIADILSEIDTGMLASRRHTEDVTESRDELTGLDEILERTVRDLPDMADEVPESVLTAEPLPVPSSDVLMAELEDITEAPDTSASMVTAEPVPIPSSDDLIAELDDITQGQDPLPEREKDTVASQEDIYADVPGEEETVDIPEPVQAMPPEDEDAAETETLYPEYGDGVISNMEADVQEALNIDEAYDEQETISTMGNETEMTEKNDRSMSSADAALAKIKKQEIIDSLVSDIKNMYMSLSDKNKSLEDRERELFVKYMQLDQREKEMSYRGERLSDSALEMRRRSMRFADDDILGPSDNVTVVRDINRAIDTRYSRRAAFSMDPVDEMSDEDVANELEQRRQDKLSRREEEEKALREELESLREQVKNGLQREEDERLRKEREEKAELERLRQAEQDRIREQHEKEEAERKAELDRLRKAQEELDRIRQAEEDRAELERLRLEQDGLIARGHDIPEPADIPADSAAERTRIEIERQIALLRENQEKLAKENEDLRAENEASMKMVELAKQAAEKLAEESSLREEEKTSFEEELRRTREKAEQELRDAAEQLKNAEEKLSAAKAKAEEEMKAARAQAEEELRAAKARAEEELKAARALAEQELSDLRAQAEEASKRAVEETRMRDAEREAHREELKRAREQAEKNAKEILKKGENELEALKETLMLSKAEAEEKARLEKEKALLEQEQARLEKEKAEAELREAREQLAQARNESPVTEEPAAAEAETPAPDDTDDVDLEAVLDAYLAKREDEKKEQARQKEEQIRALLSEDDEAVEEKKEDDSVTEDPPRATSLLDSL